MGGVASVKGKRGEGRRKEETPRETGEARGREERGRQKKGKESNLINGHGVLYTCRFDVLIQAP